LENALSNHADEILTSLTLEQQALAEVLFRSLCERQSEKRDTRRPVKLKEVMEIANVSEEEIGEIVKFFQQEGCNFLVSDKRLNQESIVDISHESLIRQWLRLKDWTIDEAETAKSYQRLEDRALEWQKNKADFLQSPELQIFQQWWEEKKPTASWAKRYGEYFVLTDEFLVSSQLAFQRLQKAETKRRRLVIVGLVCFSVVVSGLAGFSFLQYKEAKLEAKHGLPT
jgi:hypothetical protein